MDMNSVKQMSNSPHPGLGMFEGNTPYDAMYFISLFEQQLG
jgi:hypothetical protein